MKEKNTDILKDNNKTNLLTLNKPVFYYRNKLSTPHMAFLKLGSSIFLPKIVKLKSCPHKKDKIYKFCLVGTQSWGTL